MVDSAAYPTAISEVRNPVRHETHRRLDNSRFPDHDFSRPFCVRTVSQSHPIIISRLLLCIALCIQQLPRTFDQSQLHLSGSLVDLMEKYVATVVTVTSDDELIGTMEGKEC